MWHKNSNRIFSERFNKSSDNVTMIHDIKLNDPILTIWNGPTNVKSLLGVVYNREINYHVNYNLQLVEMTGESIGRDSSATSGYTIKYHAVRTQNAPYIIEIRDYTHRQS